MGCDIHFFIEHKKEGKWTKVINPRADENLEYPDYEPDWGLDRDYELFALLCGVRSELEYEDEPIQIGMPDISFMDDVSDEVRKDLEEGSYFHNHACITLPEFLAFEWDMPWTGELDRRKRKRCKECKSYYYVDDKEIYTFAHRFHQMMKVIDVMKGLDEDPDNVRSIFAFDG